MMSMRLLADDLTGALDTAAAFVGLTGPVPGFWSGHMPVRLPATAAIDCASRELACADAIARHLAMGSVLEDCTIAFKKIDSLLRGHVFAEIEALSRTGAWAHIVLAPAFPFQGRMTRGGRQFRLQADGSWHAVGEDLVQSLREVGLTAQRCLPSDALPAGVVVMDAETDATLDDVVRAGLAVAERVLWCGSAGLAQALVRVLAEDLLPQHPVQLPLLGLFGSDQNVMANQLNRCAPFALRVGDNVTSSAREISNRLTQDKVALVGFDLPAQSERSAAAQQIHDRLAALLPQLAPPATLMVAGGETLRAVCELLGATRLDVTGALEPGVPRSTLRGGAWDGVDIISKSGAFGGPDWLADVLRSTGLALERTGT